VNTVYVRKEGGKTSKVQRQTTEYNRERQDGRGENYTEFLYI